jgi:hypothetical protein
MKRIIYLSLLLVMPFMVSADHGRDRINGKWISPFHGTVIKVKVKRNKVLVKNLTSNGWITFRPSRRGKFVDRYGNTIRIKNVHELLYRGSCGTERIRFVKEGHIHHNHLCNSNCGIGDDYFSYEGDYGNYDNDYGNYDNDYGNNSDYGGGYYYSGYTNNGNNNRNNRWSNRNEKKSNKRLSGKYFVREINEYVVIEDTRNGLKARRGNRDWVNYRQNRYRKNEYLDPKRNKYQVRSDGSIFWKNKSGSISLNLTK